MGSALMTTRKAINKVGLMDENLFLYMSDVDWAKRFWKMAIMLFTFRVQNVSLSSKDI